MKSTSFTKKIKILFLFFSTESNLCVVIDTRTKGVGDFKKSGALYLSCSHHIKSHSDFRHSRMSCQITDSLDDHFLQIYIFDMSFLFVYLAKSLLTRSCYFKGQAQGLGWFLTRYPLNFAWNNDVGEIVILLKQAFSVVPKASP